MQSVVTWCQVHSFWFNIILVLIGVFVSIYGQEVKQFMHSWPRTRKTFRSFRYHTAKSHLELLKAIHGNPYQICLYFFRNAVEVALSAVVLTALAAVMYGGYFHHLPPLYALAAIASGVVMGKLLQMYVAFLHLYNYERTVRRFEQQIQEYVKKEARVIFRFTTPGEDHGINLADIFVKRPGKK